jgi:glycine hydroxymethyltransferase
MVPNGLRMGSPAMTTRGLIGEDFEKIAKFIDRAIRIALDIAMEIPSAKLHEFKSHLINDTIHRSKLKRLQEEVIQFSKAFPVIGFDELTMRYH